MITDSAARTTPCRPGKIHCGCYACDANNKNGLHLEFDSFADGSVETMFYCSPEFAGYPGILHGGIISTLLDGAMIHCLFARGHAAVTAELRIRFRHPVHIGQTTHIRAWITRYDKGYFELKSELHQQGLLKAQAVGKFLEKPDWNKTLDWHEQSDTNNLFG